jgi:2-dehydropantoate 2-reductase
VDTRPRVAEDPGAVGPQDYLFLTLKAHSLQPALPAVAPLVGPRTTIVAAVNGLPWWYTYKLPGPFEDRIVRSVDPDGVLQRDLPPAQTLGCIVYPAAEIASPASSATATATASPSASRTAAARSARRACRR